MVTDYDCWHPQHDDVSVDVIVSVLRENAAGARTLVARVAPEVRAFRGACPTGCSSSLEQALLTAPDARDPEMLRRLDAVAGRVLARQGSPE
jgi:5'-methylthioadenosine phosphorylase